MEGGCKEQVEHEADKDQDMEREYDEHLYHEIDQREYHEDQNHQMEDEAEQNRQLKTKAILKALGRDKLDFILILDGIRYQLKHETSTGETISQHRQYLCKIKKGLKKKESNLKVQIKTFENSFI